MTLFTPCITPLHATAFSLKRESELESMKLLFASPQYLKLGLSSRFWKSAVLERGLPISGPVNTGPKLPAPTWKILLAVGHLVLVLVRQSPPPSKVHSHWSHLRFSVTIAVGRICVSRILVNSKTPPASSPAAVAAAKALSSGAKKVICKAGLFRIFLTPSNPPPGMSKPHNAVKNLKQLIENSSFFWCSYGVSLMWQVLFGPISSASCKTKIIRIHWSYAMLLTISVWKSTFF